MVDGPELDLQLAGVTVRDGDGNLRILRELETSEEEQQYLSRAMEQGWPLWIETRVDGPGSELYEHPVQPWGELNRPQVRAQKLQVLLDCMSASGIGRDFLIRLLEMLPRLEDYGATRLAAEVSNNKVERDNLLLLPLMGFVPLRYDGKRLSPAIDQSLADPGEPLERFRCAELRLSLAVFQHMVLTARLPDRICPPLADGETCPRVTDKPMVRVRTRHLPKRGVEIEAIDMATAIVRYLTGTCTAVVRDIQDRLTAVERAVLAEGIDADPAFDVATPVRHIHRLGELVDHMSRELSRSLRRMPEDDDPGRHDLERDQLFRRTKDRVKDAVEELRHLQTELSFAGSTMTNLVSVRQLRAAETQKDNSEDFQRLVSKLGAVLLLPGLIAAVWGANVWLPGESQELGFFALVLLMIGGAVAVWQLIEAHWQRRSVAQMSGGASANRDTKPGRVVYGVAVVAFLAGLCLMVAAGVTATESTDSSPKAAQQ